MPSSQSIPAFAGDTTNILLKSNIVLIGMPASGKSTLGVVLAKILGMQFEDLDIRIQTQMGATLQDLIDERGTDGFTEIENTILRAVECEHTVLSTGGSAIYSDEAMRHLAAIGTVVYLEVPCEEIAARVGNLDVRGVVMRGNVRTVRDLYDERLPLYEKYADITVNIAGMHVGEAATKTADILRALHTEVGPYSECSG